MLITVKSASLRDLATRLKCPACNAPMVGTKPIRAPSALACATASLVSAIEVTALKLGAVVCIGISAIAHFFAVALHWIAHRSRQICVLLQELWREPVVQPEQIGQYQYLPIAMGSCAYSDCGNRNRF